MKSKIHKLAKPTDEIVALPWNTKMPQKNMKGEKTMKQITAHFEDVQFADYASGDLRNRLGAKAITVHSAIPNDEEDPVNYPIKPEYLEPSHTQYLEGMPHVLSNGPIFNRYHEPRERKGASLSCRVDDSQVRQAVSCLLSRGGHDIQIEK